MRISVDGSDHLTYCTNIYAAETLPDVMEGLRRHLPNIKARLSPDAPFGVGLRLAALASEKLRDPGALKELKDFLNDEDCYVFTLNGFPYGTFHGQPIKEDAYRPDWSEPSRLSYTNDLADQLAALLPDDMEGSVSTVPGSYKAWVDDARKAAVTNNILNHAAHLHNLREKTGKTVTLALEPEPACMIETIAETVAYFEECLFSNSGISHMAFLTGLDAPDAEKALRRHLGLCYDVCHAAVEFEDPADSIAALKRSGVGIFKLQLSAALRVPRVTSATAEHLRTFVEPVYLHQTIQRKNGTLTRFPDLPQALSAMDEAEGSEWRTHFHVPIFLEKMRDFDTTQFFLRDILAIHTKDPISNHLEVETYTWDVLPDSYRGVPIAEAIARELSWVLGVLR